MRSIVSMAACLGVLVATAAWSAVPSTISYQGVLTDNGGNLVPDGNYDVTFRVYDVASGGAPLYTEPHTGLNQVAISKGGFSVILGSLTPLTLPFDAPYNLGVQVGAGAELLPRIALTAGPYSLSLRLPFSGSASGGAPALRIANPGGGPAAQIEPRLDVGSPTSNADLRWYASGSEACGVIRGIQGVGGDIEIFDEFGSPLDALTFNFLGQGGFLYVAGDAAGTRYGYLDGNTDGAGNPQLQLSGESTISFNTGLTGDPAAALPFASVSSLEMMNEPGLS